MEYTPRSTFVSLNNKVMKKALFILISATGMTLTGCADSCCAKKCTSQNVKPKNEQGMKPNDEKPVMACSLTNVDKKERMKIIEEFKGLIKGKKKIENGLVLEFDGSNENYEKVNSLVKLERQCCSFLTFDLRVGKESQPLVLTISGPEGTHEFLAEELGL